MNVFGVIPISGLEEDGSKFRKDRILESLIENRIEALNDAMPGLFAVFTSDLRVERSALDLGWPLLQRPLEKEPSGTVAEAIGNAFSSSGADVLAWISPFTPFFGAQHVRLLIERWEAGMAGNPDTLIASSQLWSYAFLNGSELNFQSSDFDLPSKDVLPIEYSNLPFSLIRKDCEPPYSVVKPNSQMVVVPEWAMYKVHDDDDAIRLQSQGLI